MAISEVSEWKEWISQHHQPPAKHRESQHFCPNHRPSQVGPPTLWGPAAGPPGKGPKDHLRVGGLHGITFLEIGMEWMDYWIKIDNLRLYDQKTEGLINPGFTLLNHYSRILQTAGLLRWTSSSTYGSLKFACVHNLARHMDADECAWHTWHHHIAAEKGWARYNQIGHTEIRTRTSYLSK